MWVQKLPGGGVDAIAYAPDGRTLYTRDRGRALTAWDVATHHGRRHFAGVGIGYARAIYPLADGRIVGVGRPITVWDVNGGEKSFGDLPLGWPGDAVRVTPDGRIFYLDPSGRQIAGRDLNTGADLPPRTAPDASSNIIRFALAPDEKTVAVTYQGSPTVIYEWTDSELRNPVVLQDAWDARFSPDGRVLALSRGGPRVTLWDTASWKPRAEITPCWITETTFAINPVLPVFAAIVSGSLTLYSLETGAVVRSLDFELGKRTLCTCFSPDGLTCAVGGSNKQFAVFDVDL